jgi:MarR family transcriptional regulator for hemolysin
MDQALRPFRRTLFGDFDPADIEATLRVLSALPAAMARLTAPAADRKGP